MFKSIDNEKIWELYESPWYNHSQEFMRNINLNIDKVKHSGQVVDRFEDYDVYTFKRNPNALAFTSDYDIISYFEYKDSSIDNAIQIKFTWNNPKFKGVFRNIFIDYILPKFGDIQSDDMLTGDAFNFWKKLILEYPQYNYFVISNGEWIRLSNPSEIDNYKERILDDNSTFFISSKSS